MAPTPDEAPTGEVTVTELAESGVFGVLARPATGGPFPAVVAFGGSGGGLGPSVGWAPALASRGFAVVAVAYFGAPGLPGALAEIEVEVVERAAHCLRERAPVFGPTVGVMGMSRGSELALLASVLVDDVGPVVAFAPSGISWSGLGPLGPVDAPAWTFRGDPIPYVAMPGGASPPAATAAPSAGGALMALRPMFEAALADPTVWAHAEIPVERAKGPILLVSGEDDAMWPATTMGAMIERRAAERGSPQTVAHLHYPNAGHAGAGVPGAPAETKVHHPLTSGYYALGGTAAGNAAARAHSWPLVVEFLTDTLQPSSQGDPVKARS
jgi:dienelactone hydrolase